MNLRQLISMASHEDGQKARELEYTFYGKLADPTQLQRAYEVEKQEQWLIPIDSDVDGKLRIRAVEGRYLICTKIRREGVKGVEEVEMEITEDLFNHLKEMGTGGNIKKRYYFKIEGNHDMVWEIDQFPAVGGGWSSWVKIDLEVPRVDAAIPEWPVDFAELITNQPSQQTQE
jgi:hypothetical protein